HDLGAVVVAERKAGSRSPLASLPAVPVAGHQAHQLSTPLGTILQWESGGVATIVAGSVTSSVARPAAADLRCPTRRLLRRAASSSATARSPRSTTST